jgi:hypothetical protein
MAAMAGQSPTSVTARSLLRRLRRRFRRIDSDARATRFFTASRGKGLSRKS